VKDCSQFGEFNLVIQPFFKRYKARHGVVVDVGAYGKEMSNAYNLIADYNWLGILFEPFHVDKCIAEYESISNKVVFEPWVISDTEGEADFYIHNVDGHHSLEFECVPSTRTGQVRTVQTRTLQSALDQKRAPIDFDFLSMDTNGTDGPILVSMFANSEYRPRLIMFEHSIARTGTPDECDGFMKDGGYQRRWQNKHNVVYEKIVQP